MNHNIEEAVKLPEALAEQLGDMTVQYQGWQEADRDTDETSNILCDVVWSGRRYPCPLLLPLQGIVFDEQLTQDCSDRLGELVEREAELEWRAKYLEKIESLVQKAVVRLYKQLLKAKTLPQGLRPKRVPRSAIT